MRDLWIKYLKTPEEIIADREKSLAGCAEFFSREREKIDERKAEALARTQEHFDRLLKLAEKATAEKTQECSE